MKMKYTKNLQKKKSDFMENIDIDALLREYKRIFEEYYNREDYVLKLSSFPYNKSK